MVTRTCAGCGTEFDARANSIYCSSACRQRAYRNRNAAKRRVAASADTPSRPIGRPNVKRQIRMLEYADLHLDALAHGMEDSFREGRFEKTCTAEVAAEYADSLSDSLRRIRKVVRVLRDHGRRR